MVMDFTSLFDIYSYKDFVNWKITKYFPTMCEVVND